MSGLVGWGRRIQLLGALVLMVAPFLGWAEVRLLGTRVGLPGLMLGGAALLALGLASSIAVLVRARLPAFHGLAGLVAVAVTGWDLHHILARTQYVMDRLQLSLIDVNQMLARFNVSPIELFTREPTPWRYVGTGVWVAFAGAGLLLVGVGLEVLGYRRDGKSALSSALGLPRCSRCGFRVGHDMHFCPGCGELMVGEHTCTACGAPIARGFRYCPACGGKAATEPSSSPETAAAAPTSR